MRTLITSLFILSFGMGGVAVGAQPLSETLTQNEAASLARSNAGAAFLVMDIETVIEIAREKDPWLAGNRHAQDAVDARSVAAGSLPDPELSLDAANLPAYSFNLSQEGMSHIRVGIAQAFPPGATRSIKRRQLEHKSAAYPYQRADREAKIAVTVGQLWLDAYREQESITLIEENRGLFEQLSDIAEAGYATGVGRGRQQNVVRAQLELTRLEDRLTVLHQRQEMFREKLGGWLNAGFDGYSAGRYTFSRELPDLPLRGPRFVASAGEADGERLFRHISDHPALRALEQEITASETGVDLAKQKYKPKWGLRAGYGYRAGDPMGNDRSDLLSAGVTLSLPLFTGKRQDKEVQAARSTASAMRTQKWQRARELMAGYETAKAQLHRLDQRQTLYQSRLLPQMQDQAEAALAAYTNDDGDFAEVVRARIAQVDAEIEALAVDVERQKVILQLNYFFARSDADVAGNDRTGETP